MKTCSKCGVRKPHSEFYARTDRPGWLNPCQDCRKQLTRGRAYGITDAAWEALRADQRNACAACREPFNMTPHTDHNHTTGVVRGLLCFACNLTLGHSKENSARLLGLVDYLDRHT